MTTLSASIEVDAPAERTWDLLVDWARQGEWMPMTQVRVSAESATGVGGRISARSGVGPASFVDPMVIEVWDPPYRCEVLHLGKVVRGRGIFLVEPLPGGRSRFTWQEVLDGTGINKALALAGLPPTKLLMTVALRRMARLVVADEDAA